MKKILKFWIDLAQVIFWFSMFGAYVFGNYTPSKFIIGVVFLVVAWGSLTDLLEGSDQ